MKVYNSQHASNQLNFVKKYLMLISRASRNGPWQCSTCQKLFKVQSMLISHERVHNGERPYVCVHPGCHWSFRTSSKLRRHERSHKNDRR